MTSTVILGLGEDLRADDAAGLLAVRELQRLGIEAAELRDPYLLPDALAGAEEAFLIDAVVCDEPEGALVVIDGTVRQPELRFPASTHGFGLAEGLELARILGGLPSRCTIYGISAKRFEIGEPPSEAVRAGAIAAARAVRDRILAQSP